MENKPIYFLSDIHGKFQTLENKILELNLQDCYIIQKGDFGIGFRGLEIDTQILFQLNLFLKNRNIKMYAIRGNHDDPKYFKAKDLYLPNQYLYLVPDYTMLNLNGSNFFLVGGALSIDRMSRSEGSSYWKTEEFVYKPELVPDSSFQHIDYVITHTSPIFCYPKTFQHEIVQYFISIDKKLKGDLINERLEMNKLYIDILEKGHIPYRWYYGHFHCHHEEMIGETEFIVTNIFEFTLLQ